ncbi:hypothetical protein AGMMS49573_03590 [Endomicrobiia bacterium]|uniref:hypothetical protein n=1 Tax=Endomicrobium trichonymphae TaxID=1408204 RepID=UPI000BBA967D|nr:hypothetical protein [Candidatus Endomicrobium trichonymphae]GHT07554.1 hypothetical protein AGMMS49532_00550 [Endomicrobiia bacterium]GHT15864.1 hypothetical protein AGMMS49573_03590 [Endomicrobiia bacterium]
MTPVLPIVYKEQDIDKYYNPQFIKENFVKEFVNDLLFQLFKISDFRLVDIAHSDRVWKKYFDKQEKHHKTEMLLEEIIDEYVSKI